MGASMHTRHKSSSLTQPGSSSLLSKPKEESNLGLLLVPLFAPLGESLGENTPNSTDATSERISISSIESMSCIFRAREPPARASDVAIMILPSNASLICTLFLMSLPRALLISRIPFSSFLANGTTNAGLDSGGWRIPSDVNLFKAWMTPTEAPLGSTIAAHNKLFVL
jgi:hypothetical protein